MIFGKKKNCAPLKPATVQQSGRRSHCLPRSRPSRRREDAIYQDQHHHQQAPPATAAGSRDKSRKKEKKCHGNGKTGGGQGKDKNQHGVHSKHTSGIGLAGQGRVGSGWSEPVRSGLVRSGSVWSGPVRVRQTGRKPQRPPGGIPSYIYRHGQVRWDYRTTIHPAQPKLMPAAATQPF